MALISSAHSAGAYTSSARTVAVLSAVVVVLTAGCGDDGPSWPGDATRAVVVVESQRCDRPTRFSGFGVRVNGTIVTAAHTVEGDLRDLRVDGGPATVLTIDHRTDLAVLAMVEDDGPSVDLATPEAVEAAPRLWLLRAGDASAPVAPLDGVRSTRLTVDDATARRRYERDAIAFSGEVPEGTSGAPIVTGDGKVAGVVVLTVGATGQSYAVSSKEIGRVIARKTDRTLERIPGCA